MQERRGDDVRRVIETVWQMESPKIIAALARHVGDFGTAEDLAHDALVAALEKWPEKGPPPNPGAWLMTVAKNRAIDFLRRRQNQERKYAELGQDLQAQRELTAPDIETVLAGETEDDLLRLIFMCCHPVLSREARVALTLRALGGLTTSEIARAFLVSEATMAQRIVRAKRTLREARVSFEVPDGPERAARLASVLEVIYLIFNEGYTATRGDDWVRPPLCEEALRLGRILAELMPAEGEVHGLVALLELQASRLRTRMGPGGEPILLLDQDRLQWDQLLIRRGLAALERAAASGTLGPYGIQAAIAACHATARTPEETDWKRIAALYDALSQLAPSPVVELNRAVALAMAYGPAVGLEIVDELMEEPCMARYHQLPSVRGDLLARLGRFAEARYEFERAAALTGNGAERDLLLRRAAEAAQGQAPPPWPSMDEERQDA